MVTSITEARRDADHNFPSPLIAVLAAALALLAALALPARAHEMTPSILNVTVAAEEVRIEARVPAEAMVAGIDLSAVRDTNNSPRAQEYDRLRALSPDELTEVVQDNAPLFEKGVEATVEGAPVALSLTGVEVIDQPDAELPRDTILSFSAALPPGDGPVAMGFSPRFGEVILRQQAPDGTDDPDGYAALISPGQVSAPMPRSEAARLGWLENVGHYIVIGFEHILPKGLDHILFVLGLFFFSLRMRPLVSQVTTFTVAHTLTLALATLGIVSVPAAIVEPLIALSIAYVGIENIARREMTRLRLAVIFGFGLLHGLGFASVLGDIGLSPAHFVSSLISFNIGVELGQLTILLIAYLTIGIWFGRKPWYHRRIAVPASLAIAAMGLWWAVERTVL